MCSYIQHTMYRKGFMILRPDDHGKVLYMYMHDIMNKPDIEKLCMHAHIITSTPCGDGRDGTFTINYRLAISDEA